MEENQIKTEEIAKAQTEATQEKQIEVEANLHNIYAERLKQKAAELDAVEKQIDQKIADFKEFVKKTELGGRGMAAMEKTEKQTIEEASQRRIAALKASIGRK